MERWQVGFALLAMCFAVQSCRIKQAPEESAGGRELVRGLYVGSDIIACDVWNRWGPGCATDSTVKHGGRTSLRCDVSQEGQETGARQTITFDQKEPREIVISGWSKAENVAGQKDWGYSIYLDLKYADGKSLFMQTVQFEPGTHDWQYGETVVKPEKPLAEASVNVFLRKHTGVVWFDDIKVCERKPDGAPGPNMVRDGDFEAADNLDLTKRHEVFAKAKDMNANAIHIYVGATSHLWKNPFEPPAEGLPDPFAHFVDDAHKHGLGVWVTIGPRFPALKSTNDPEFPFYYCVNNRFGEEWIKTIAAISKYPIDAIGMVPDEYNYAAHYAKERYEKSSDAELAEFYKKLDPYCTCGKCQTLFSEKYGGPPPFSPNFKTHEMEMRQYLQFRYDSTFDWIKKSVEAAKASNPGIRTDSLICVSPICSDRRYHSGVAWDMIGYHSGIDMLTTDPYILLHNYKGDSTHYYVTETANHLVGSSKKRGGGVVLEISRLRKEHRLLDDVEIYGPPLTSVAHGAGEAFYFHINCIMKYNLIPDPKRNESMVRQAFRMMKEIDPWLRGSHKPREIAFLYSRTSDDIYQIYTRGEKPPFLIHEDTDERYPFIAQKEVMYLLFRNAYSFEFYPLEQVSYDELRDFRAILVPFPFSISKKQADLLKRLASDGKSVVIVSEFGTVDELGEHYERPLLLDLIGLERAPTAEAESALAFDAESPVLKGKKIDGKFAIYSDLALKSGARLIASGANGKGGIVLNKVGKGDVIFLGGEFGIRIPKQPVEVHKGPTAKVPLAPLDPGHVEVMTSVLDHALGGKRLLRLNKKPEQDIEAVARTNSRGDVSLFLINWDNAPAEFTVGLDLPRGDYRVEEVILDGMKASPLRGAITPAADLAGVKMTLASQEAKVIRFSRTSGRR
ncbi:MAG: hypothetical protein AB1696_03400 [Planctomycetota bacterium]